MVLASRHRLLERHTQCPFEIDTRGAESAGHELSRRREYIERGIEATKGRREKEKRKADERKPKEKNKNKMRIICDGMPRERNDFIFYGDQPKHRTFGLRVSLLACSFLFLSRSLAPSFAHCSARSGSKRSVSRSSLLGQSKWILSRAMRTKP